MGGCTHSQGTNIFTTMQPMQTYMATLQRGHICLHGLHGCEKPLVRAGWAISISPYFAWSEKTVFSACKASISSSFPVWTGYACTLPKCTGIMTTTILIIISTSIQITVYPSLIPRGMDGNETAVFHVPGERWIQISVAFLASATWYSFQFS